MDRGYILFPRELMDEDFWKFTPVARQIFLYLMLRVNYVDGKNGYKRGQGFFSYGKIKEDLSWYVGFRKHSYTDSQIRNAMNHLVKSGMINTMKTTRGLRVTICKYKRYQDPKYYERHNEQQAEQHNDRQDERTPEDALYVKESINNTKEKEEYIVDLNKNELSSKEIESLDVTKSKDEVTDSGGIKKGMIREVRELAFKFLKWQPESELYLIRKAVEDMGYERVAETTKYYGEMIESGQIEKDYIVSSSRYWWSSGIYSWSNKVETRAKIDKVEEKKKLVKRKCSDCHTLFELEPDKIPSICPKCNQGMLLTNIEYASQFPQEPKDKPKEEVFTPEEQQAKDNVMAFLDKFSSRR